MPPWTALPWLSLLLLLSPVAAAAGAGRAPCVLRSPLAGGQLGIQASDGQELLSAAWDPRTPAGLSDCRVSAEPRDVAAFLGRCGAVGGQGPGPGPGPPAFPGLAEAKAACSGGPPPRQRSKRGFTYPGTLWCGAGDIAESYDTLGEHQETDRCCRAHDHCQHVIHPFTYKYGYRNFRFHTISHCDCDNRLKACLRAVNDTASRVVGQAFFNVIQVPCFKFTYKEQCIEPYLYVWCKNYSTVAVAVVQEPVLYDYGGELIDGLATRLPPAGTFPPAPPARKPGQAMATTTAAPPARPSRRPKKHRKGKAKGKERKGERKGLTKKQQQQKAGTKADDLAFAFGEERGISRKRLAAAQELGKVDFHDPAQLPDAGEEDPFNAILSDDPEGGGGGGGDLRGGEGRAQAERKEPAPLKATSGPSSVHPQRRKGKRRRRLQEKEGRRQHSAAS
ncbi:protein PROCA1 [Elgaria multicarinata webbii]|uniref:protein PROCA1 n=1 Tax=Elgaria multicarinata webbii TaxID=159646 RepID=UPI002FCD6286